MMSRFRFTRNVFIYKNDAESILISREMKGRVPPRGWADGSLQGVEYRLGSVNDTVSVEVKNVLTEIQIHNVFGVIKGLVDPGTPCHCLCYDSHN